jgi:hypothetical protein
MNPVAAEGDPEASFDPIFAREVENDAMAASDPRRGPGFGGETRVRNGRLLRRGAG